MSPESRRAGPPSLIAQLRQIGARYLFRFALMTTIIWGLVSSFAMYQMIHARARFFRSLVESNQEMIVSGEWRPFFEGLERDKTAEFTNVKICWGETSEAGCGARLPSAWLSSPVEVPLMNEGKPVVWVRAEISRRPALEFSAIILLALLMTGFAGTALMLRMKKDADQAGSDLAGAVSNALTRGDVQTLQLLPEEMRPLGEALVESIISLQQSKQREAVAKALWEISTQVAHDIRSPLAALDVVSKDISQLPEERRILVRSAVSRIRDIANNLSEKYRTVELETATQDSREKAVPKEPVAPWLLSSLIDPLVTEKRLQYRSRIGLDIYSRMDEVSYGLFAQVQSREFKRVISNLINNAVESSAEKKSEVLVTLSADDGKIFVRVTDHGKGIRPEILAKLGQRGETHDKAGGSGLGLYHARVSTETWGGRLDIVSEVGKGTSATLVLPQAPAPNWFVAELALAPGKSVVILDDDMSIHQVWQGRLAALPLASRSVEIVHFSTPTEIRNWVCANASKARVALYLLDYELLGYQETGLSLAEELGIGERVVLVTSRYEEPGILDGCRKLKARMIPKGLAGLVPIRIEELSKPHHPLPQEFDAVLIDDDPLTRKLWQAEAEKYGKKFEPFATIAAFLAESDQIGRRTPVYVDAKLADGVNGAQESIRIYDLGFKEIYLATGYPASEFLGLKHLRGVVGKEPPWSDKSEA